MNIFKRYRIIKQYNKYMLQRFEFPFGWLNYNGKNGVWFWDNGLQFDTVEEAENALKEYKTEVIKYL